MIGDRAPGGMTATAAAATVRPRIFDRRARFAAAAVALLGVLFVLLALALRDGPGTALDVRVTLLVQQVDNPIFALVMVGISEIGYAPWSPIIFGLAVVGLLVTGFWRESLLVLATHGVFMLVGFIKLLIERPRPTADVVRVLSEVGEYSFPSGHTTSYVVFFGLLFFLAFALLRRSWWRTATLVVLAVPTALVGVSRVYLGHHWASDVLGGYALGLAYLLLLIEIDRHLIATPANRRRRIGGHP